MAYIYIWQLYTTWCPHFCCTSVLKQIFLALRACTRRFSHHKYYRNHVLPFSLSVPFAVRLLPYFRFCFHFLYLVFAIVCLCRRYIWTQCIFIRNLYWLLALLDTHKHCLTKTQSTQSNCWQANTYSGAHTHKTISAIFHWSHT